MEAAVRACALAAEAETNVGHESRADSAGVKVAAVRVYFLAADAETNVGQESDALWRSHEVSLLAKITNAVYDKDFRPIAAVLPVIFKLYSR